MSLMSLMSNVADPDEQRLPSASAQKAKEARPTKKRPTVHVGEGGTKHRMDRRKTRSTCGTGGLDVWDPENKKLYKHRPQTASKRWEKRGCAEPKSPGLQLSRAEHPSDLNHTHQQSWANTSGPLGPLPSRPCSGTETSEGTCAGTTSPGVTSHSFVSCNLVLLAELMALGHLGSPK